MKEKKETLYSVFKEQLARIFSDSGVLFIIVGASVVYPILYGWVYKKEVVKDVPVAIVNQDGSSLSRQLSRCLDATEQISNEYSGIDFNYAKKLLNKGSVKGIIIIPKGLEKKVLRGEKSNVSLFADASYFMYYKQILTGVNYVVGTVNAGIRVKKSLLKGRMREDAVDKALNIKLDSRPLFNPSGGYASYLMPAVLILILQQTLLMGMGLFAGTEYAEERSWFLVKELDIKAILIQMLGRGTAFFVVYIPISIHLLINCFWIFGYPAWSNIVELLLFIFPFLLSVICFAIFLSTCFRERTSSMIFLLFTAIPMLFLSGISWPYQNMPSFWRFISEFIPSTHAIIGIYKMQIMHANLLLCQSQWIKMWELAALFFTISIFRIIQMRKRRNLN
ncbi:ABC transporter permease [Prolixibacteraceae bacterium]|nr:ABC transporter permease [Prolixibacteraceae bacterium]